MFQTADHLVAQGDRPFRCTLMHRLAALVCWACWPAALPAFAGEPEADRLPNIIVILADDMGYGDASCYGSTELATPHIDALAREGCRLTDFHSSGNVCSPTRAGLLTGRYQYRAGIPAVINADPDVEAHYLGLQREEITFAEQLRQAGYVTALFGKWHLGYAKKYNPVHNGFDQFRGYVSGNIDYHSHLDRMGTYDWWEGLELVEEEGYSTHLITRHAVQFIEQHRQRPFCLYIAHEAVHAPWQGPHDPPQRGPDRVRGKVDQQRAFQEMMQAMDQGVGDVVEKVKQLGLAERTFVFFFSDNGPAGGSAGPLRGRKGSNWEGGHRVPAVAWWPGRIPAGSQCDQLGISLDVMPTMLEIAGQQASSARPLDGVSLLPALTAGEPLGDSPRRLYWNHRAMREGPWKLVLGGKGTPRDSVGLYNLDEDLGERRDLASQHSQRVAAMKQALAAFRRDMEATQTPQPGRP